MIRADGTWIHEGREIHRKSLAKLFSTVLKLEEDHYFLVTPSEKLRITVEDAPFIIVDMEANGTNRNQSIAFCTNFDEYVIADAIHPIFTRVRNGETRPYAMIRSGLHALIVRSVYYRLAELVIETESGFKIWSAGTLFSLEPVVSS